MTNGGDSYDIHVEIEYACKPTSRLAPAELSRIEAEMKRILLDDSREDTCGCSRAAWDWFQSVVLLGWVGWIVVVCLAWCWAAKLGWEVGLWWIGS